MIDAPERIQSQPFRHLGESAHLGPAMCARDDVEAEVAGRVADPRMACRARSNASIARKEKPAGTAGLELAEGVGFEPTVGSYPYSGLANRRTRPDYATLPVGAKGGTRTPTRVNRTTP